MKELENLKSNALSKKKSFNKTAQRLKKHKKLDVYMKGLHNKAFSCIDCLECANCCKTTGPLFTTKDVDRISSHLGLSAVEFEKKYLLIDEDGDKVLNTLPCPFLGSDNFCSIYDVRPKACKDYPHTDNLNQERLLKLHVKNTEVCPAVFKIFNELIPEDQFK